MFQEVSIHEPKTLRWAQASPIEAEHYELTPWRPHCRSGCKQQQAERTSPFCWKLGGHLGVRRTGYAGRTCANGSSACTLGNAGCGGQIEQRSSDEWHDVKQSSQTSVSNLLERVHPAAGMALGVTCALYCFAHRHPEGIICRSTGGLLISANITYHHTHVCQLWHASVSQTSELDTGRQGSRNFSISATLYFIVASCRQCSGAGAAAA